MWADWLGWMLMASLVAGALGALVGIFNNGEW